MLRVEISFIFNVCSIFPNIFFSIYVLSFYHTIKFPQVFQNSKRIKKKEMKNDFSHLTVQCKQQC